MVSQFLIESELSPRVLSIMNSAVMRFSLIAMASCIVIASLTSRAQATSLHRQRRDVTEPSLAIAVLEDLIMELRDEIHSKKKRRFDAGYGSRYGVAQSVGSKLMALKQAADWNGPGRKRREAEEEA
ncbi:hypothetical protein CAPTEDRAFT_215078 [Capitella teleta]|uniref:Uncharacterized protein n=1 Tax=Capitella teleta TaxID=283909 RepID=R7UR66_CAPTE|nr:hypothetical protein CAPTEDRAFT_215078 [Capitella teleta]|eukprot:ELU08670.1 hypothetical protein CAPTEDRAFT_215078 [Capitella teleta]